MDFQPFLDKQGIVKMPLPTPFPAGPVNTYLLRRDALTLVDTGLNNDESYDELVRQLKEQHLSLRDIEVILVTHGHRDHMGLLGRLLQETNAKAYGHPHVNLLGAHDDSISEQKRDFFSEILNEFGVPDDVVEVSMSSDRFRRFSDPFQLDYLLEHDGHTLGFDTYFVPGHSSSDTLFVDEKNEFTICADHLLTNISPNPLLRVPDKDGPRPKCMIEFQQSLRESRDRDLGICLPGHGNVFGDHVAVVNRLLDKHERRSNMVIDHLKNGHTTPYAISKKLFPRLPDTIIHMGLSITIGHLEVLEQEGRLTSSFSDGVLHFSI
jgi:glyoxylase-like metal-dependent hydrolase (beta-lactamase superfamily II)